MRPRRARRLMVVSHIALLLSPFNPLNIPFQAIMQIYIPISLQKRKKKKKRKHGMAHALTKESPRLFADGYGHLILRVEFAKRAT